MDKKRIVFEGKIDGIYSQIYYQPEVNQFFLMRHIKESSRNRAIKQIVELNKTRKPENRVNVVARLYKNKKADFAVGRITQKTAQECVQKYQKNQVQGKSQILNLPENYSYENANQTSYIGSMIKKCKGAGKEFLQNIKKDADKKVIAIALLTSMAVAGSALVVDNMINKPTTPETIPPGYATTMTTPNSLNPTEPTNSETNKYYVELEDVVLQTQSNGSLTNESARDLSNGIVNEINELYSQTDWSTPQIIESETLASLFYVENTLKPEDSKDAYVGIGQMSKVAVKSAITRANKLYNRANSKSELEGMDNYVVDNICSKENENIDEQANRLWEQSKTDAKMCGCLTGLYLADLSDRYESSLNGNKVAIIIMYNAGEGNFQNYQKLGIVNLTFDKAGMTIDLNQVDKLETSAKRAKWNEAINYVIKVLEGSKRLKENPNASVHEICEQTRLDVGKNDNNSATPNLEQYKYAPDGVVFALKEMEMNSQPGE